MKIKIALVEDHAKLRAAIASVLTGFGFAVMIQAHCGKELLTCLETANKLPDICVLDCSYREGY